MSGQNNPVIRAVLGILTIGFILCLKEGYVSSGYLFKIGWISLLLVLVTLIVMKTYKVKE